MIQNMGDPVVLYDQYSDRWIITDFAWSTTKGPFYECIAVSKTADPGKRRLVVLCTASPAATELNDYPKLGVWPDGIYMSANMFTRATPLRRGKGLGIEPSRYDQRRSHAQRGLHAGHHLLHAVSRARFHRHSTVPAGTPNYFMSLYAPSTMRMWKFTVNWTTPTSSTFTGPTAITVASFTKPTTSGFVPQLGSSTKLDTLGDRLMVQIQYHQCGRRTRIVVQPLGVEQQRDRHPLV